MSARGARDGFLRTPAGKRNLRGIPFWLAARCASRLGPITSWQYGADAHTSAVYLTVPGQELFSAPVATYLLTLIDGSQTFVETLATRPGPEQFERIRNVFKEARARLQTRLKQHSTLR